MITMEEWTEQWISPGENQLLNSPSEYFIARCKLSVYEETEGPRAVVEEVFRSFT